VTVNKMPETMLNTLNVGLGTRSYDIHIGPQQLSRLGNLLSDYAPTKRIVVVTDENIHGLYGDALLDLPPRFINAACHLFRSRQHYYLKSIVPLAEKQR